jgi:hypothetical protein
MKSIIGVYESHEQAVTAISKLKKSGYPDKLLSLFGKVDIVDGHVRVKAHQSSGSRYVTIGIASAAVLETLAVIGIFAVPGFGLLFGAGAAVGGFAGLSTALIAGGDVRAIFSDEDLSDSDEEKYEKLLMEGKFLVFADGDDQQLKQAHDMLLAQELALELT